MRKRDVAFVSVLAGLALVGAAAPGSPGREPVLKQIKVPHRYYFREMYLPQLTSGPSSLAWSPRRDGDGLRHAGVAVAHGAGLRPRPADHRRARIPLPARLVADGRFVVFAAYDQDAVELRVPRRGDGRAFGR